MIDYIKYIHFIVLIFCIFLPFYPIFLLKYICFIPLLIPILWLIFNGCPINYLEKKPTFVSIIEKYKKKYRLDYISCFVLTLSIAIITVRLSNYYNKNNLILIWWKDINNK